MSLRDQLQTIYDAHGRLTPDLIVETARPVDHPLHARVFDRPPNQAAEAWYRSRAHELIQSCRITYRSSDNQPRDVRAFQALRGEDPDNGGFQYEPVEDIIADPFKRELLMREMEREWRALKSRYDRLAEFVDMVLSDMEHVGT